MVDLSVMIAREINDDTGKFGHIHFDEDQLKEIKFAALMHDIGKITTPEYVIDKSTKLETIYDRINNVELRFEILKRDAYTQYLESKSTIGDPVILQKREELYNETIKELDNEINFLKTANIGGEFFSDENIQKVHSIAQRTICLNGIDEPILNADEVINLTVQKGTLTYDQRMIINNHAYVSLRMLEQLPFPRKLDRVAEIACGHHEKISGGGYPLGLKGDELSFEARILAIADIFEALSASDRPYKKGKKLSEVMKILFFMAKDGDIDMDIIRFIYESGLYLRYAQATLSAEYIDEVILNFDFEGTK
jgi:response regulator RpfG family c-di-GMP phosphodiesterase